MTIIEGYNYRDKIESNFQLNKIQLNKIIVKKHSTVNYMGKNNKLND
jgi:hypothetical protein